MGVRRIALGAVYYWGEGFICWGLSGAGDWDFGPAAAGWFFGGVPVFCVMSFETVVGGAAYVVTVGTGVDVRWSVVLVHFWGVGLPL